MFMFTVRGIYKEGRWWFLTALPEFWTSSGAAAVAKYAAGVDTTGDVNQTFKAALTPADEDEPPEVLPVREEGDSEERVEVKTFHQQPKETGHDAILEEHDRSLAANLWNTMCTFIVHCTRLMFILSSPF